MNVTSHHPCDLQWSGQSLRIVSLASWQRCFWFYDPTTGLLNTSVGGSEIPSNHMGCIKPLSKINGINYQLQLVSNFSEPSTVWKQNLSQIFFSNSKVRVCFLGIVFCSPHGSNGSFPRMMVPDQVSTHKMWSKTKRSKCSQKQTLGSSWIYALGLEWPRAKHGLRQGYLRTSKAGTRDISAGRILPSIYLRKKNLGTGEIGSIQFLLHSKHFENFMKLQYDVLRCSMNGIRTPTTPWHRPRFISHLNCFFWGGRVSWCQMTL